MAIISHKYKFIFIKTGKVAGTSVELSLRPHLGVNDIATPVVSYDEEKAIKLNIPPPQNYDKNYSSKMHDIGAKGIIAEHSWAYEIKGIVGDKIWDTYFKFTIERNPIEKIVSHYYHFKNPIHGLSIIRGLLTYLKFIFIKNRINRIKINKNPFKSVHICRVCTLQEWFFIESYAAYSQNFLRYSINDNIIVDKVYNYEKLDELCIDLEKIIGSKIKLIKTKNNFRKDKRKYNPQKIDKNTLERIYNHPIFSKEFDLLNIKI